jgi:hypothetical protein
MVDRTTLIDALRGALDAPEFTHAAWLGGSDATGRTDQWSDVDLAVIVDDDAVEETFAIVEAALERLSPIAVRVRLPQPTWHGHDQAFYQLRDAEPTLMIDLSVMKLSHPDRFMEPERHGTPIVLFDRNGLVVPAELDRADLSAKMRRRLAELSVRFPMFQNLVTKAVYRDSMVEALFTFQSMTMRPLIDVLRMRYAPERFDFGPRYLQFDLPINHYRQLEWMSMPTDGEGLLERQAFGVRLFEQTVDELEKFDVIGAFERGEAVLTIS